jgi:hypothetical protein
MALGDRDEQGRAAGRQVVEREIRHVGCGELKPARVVGHGAHRGERPLPDQLGVDKVETAGGLAPSESAESRPGAAQRIEPNTTLTCAKQYTIGHLEGAEPATCRFG